MATPVEALTSRSFSKKHSLTPATTPNTARCFSFLNQVLLHDWWLVRADSDSHGKRLGIGGFTFNFKEGQEIRCFCSAPVVERHDAVTLKTVDDITIMVQGYLNKSRTLENGFSHEVCDHFLIGFPYYWEEFAALSDSEERADFSGSRGASCSGAYKPPAAGDHGSNVQSGNTFDPIPSESSSGKKETSIPIPSKVSVNHNKIENKKKRRGRSHVERVKHSGPLTRSRARSTTRSGSTYYNETRL